MTTLANHIWPTACPVPMLQAGPASLHASRRSSSPPVGDGKVSPSSTRRWHPGTRDQCQNSSSVPHTDGENQTRQAQPGTFDVCHVLNPLELQLPGLGASGFLPTEVLPSGGESPVAAHGSIPGPSPVARLPPAAQPASIPLPGKPGGPATPLGDPSSGRISSMMASLPPAVNNTREKLSSTRPPRAMSHGHKPPSNRDSDVRKPPPPSASPAKRPYKSEILEETTRSDFPCLQHLPGMPSDPPSAMSAPGRSLSQPAIPSPGIQAPPPILPPSTASGRPQQPPMPPQGPYPPNMQTGRPFLGAGPLSEGSSPWTETIRRHGMGGALSGVEGQQAFMTLPGSDTPIVVPVDFSQASKKADEKRQRNAVASTRHRRKKKILQEENTKQLQELRDERRMMELKIEELTQQRGFYREERNRLRDIVAQTPSISGLAVGPPSPSFASGFSTDTSSLTQGTQGPQGYGGDSRMGEHQSADRRMMPLTQPAASLTGYPELALLG